MNEQEIDLMDELYFVQSYKDIKNELKWGDSVLQENLLSLHQKEFIKILVNHDEEYRANTYNPHEMDWERLYFLATKKGLLEHNGF